MAFDKTPTTHIAGYTSDGTNITIPLASLTFPDQDGTMQPLLTAAKANPTTGDIREISRAFNLHLGRDFASLPSADRPQRMTIQLSTPTTTGLPPGSTNLIRRNYSGYFDETIDPTISNVANEPA